MSTTKKSKLHPNILWLGVASMFNDMSGEIVARALPLFLTATLGVGASVVGLIEGIADTTSSLLKIFSGWYSDKFKTRKAPTVVGYALTAIARPLLLIQSKVAMPLASRFLDRAGKGVRTAPRDALIADSVASTDRGRGFGVQRALDTAGAVIGALIAAIAVSELESTGQRISEHTFTILVYLAIVPSFISVAVIALLVKNVRHHSRQPGKITGFSGPISPVFGRYLIILAIFSLGASSDAFLLLRSAELGLAPASIFFLVAAFNLVGALTAYPIGKLSDKIGKKKMLIIGWTYYGIVYFGFAFADSTMLISMLFIAYGLYYGLTEGVEKAFVADLVDADHRGTSYGYFNAVIGLAALPASFGFGFLYQQFGAAVAFGSGSLLALAASFLLAVMIKPAGKN
ncbi:MAG TPA: MFS transporter [Candidatus Kapabacteria bacterium]|nr:MFS transporter [Candidatus Kapabacteria bacterium]